MPIQVEAVFGRNITMVYDGLDISKIDRNKIREVFQGNSPTIMDMPDMIVAIFPPNPLLIQIGDRRIRINYTTESPDISEFPIWDYVNKSKILLSGINANLIAYGYNFDFGVHITDTSVDDLLITKFISNTTNLEQKLKGSLVSFLPRIIFKRDKIQYDIIFEPFEKNRLKVHGNTHFQENEVQLPDTNDLHKSYIEQFNQLKTIILDMLS